MTKDEKHIATVLRDELVMLQTILTSGRVGVAVGRLGAIMALVEDLLKVKK